MTMETARIYTPAEVDAVVAELMAALPPGSSISSRIENAGRSVHLHVRLPDGGKQEVFEHGWVGYGGTLRGKSRPGRPGPTLDEFAIKVILQWSKK